MSYQEQKNADKRATGTELNEGQDEEYEEYLFWPSLCSQNVSSGAGDHDTPSSPLYGPVSLHSESTEFEYSGLSGPPSPITFAPAVDYWSQSPMGLDFGAVPSSSPEAGAKVEAELPKEQKLSEPVGYSPIFRLGLLLSQMTHLVNRAIDGVKIKTRKPRSQAP